MSAKIQIRRDTALNWTATNPTLAQGEPGLETDSNKVKYGDGSTAWNLLDYASGGASTGNGDFSTGFTDGVNDNTYHFIQVQGKKEFEFKTEGYTDFTVTLTAPMVVDIGNSNLTFTSVDTPEMDQVYLEYTRNNGINVYLKSEFDVGNFTNYYSSIANPEPGVYTIGLTTNTFTEGAQLIIKYWSEGTTYTGSYYDTYDTWYPDASSVGATNTVTLKSDYAGWLGSGPGSAFVDLLNPTYAGNHALTFMSDSANDVRNITGVVDNNDNTFTVTFDGAAKETTAIILETFTYSAIDSQTDSWTVTIPRTAWPTFAEDATYPWDAQQYKNNQVLSGTVAINGGEPQVFFWYWNFSNNNFIVNMNNATITYAQGDTIDISFYKQSTKIQLSIYRPQTNNWNNGYKWFDWKDDLDTEYSPNPGNGIQGGTGQILMQFFRAPLQGDTGDKGSLVVPMGWTGVGNYQRSPYDPYRRDSVSNWGYDANNCYPMYDFDENGIVFYNNGNGNNSYSYTYKIRIIYRFDLIVGEDYYSWFDC